MNGPLQGVTVLDCGQFLAAPLAGLRLADLGARVVKVERPTGDICRTLYVSDTEIAGDSTIFHAINRGKEGVALDLGTPAGRDGLRRLLALADVVLVNFRPGVAARLGLDAASVAAVRPAAVHGEITGYGTVGPWATLPGQDLLVQAMSGACHLNGDRDQQPLSMGLSLADTMAGEHLVQGVLAALLRSRLTGRGASVQVDLLSSLLDLQFESFTTYLATGELPLRHATRNANPYLDAPYGIHVTADGHLALAMCPLPRLAALLGADEVTALLEAPGPPPASDAVTAALGRRLATRTTAEWLAVLRPADVWCGPVLGWEELLRTEGFARARMVQVVRTADGTAISTLRCPVRIDGQVLLHGAAAPRIGQDDARYGIGE